jgi:hypothetical protein
MNDNFDKQYYVIEHTNRNGDKFRTSNFYYYSDVLPEYNFYVNQFGKSNVKVFKCVVKVEEIIID